MARDRIVETRYTVPILLEAKDAEKNPDVLLRFKALLAEGGVINENERLYLPAEIVEQTAKLNTRIQERGKRPGQDGHPGMFSAPTWSTVGIGWSKTWTEEKADGRVESWGEGFVPATDAGRNVAVCMRVGFPIGISLRAGGVKGDAVMDERDPHFAANASRRGQRYTRVSELGLDTFDTVVDPGFDSATVRAFQESLEAGVLDERVRAAINKRLEEIEEERMTEDTKKKVAELEAENAGLKKALEAKVAEMTAAIDAKVAELRKALPSAEQVALLERLGKIPAEKLDAALKVAEGAAPAAPPAPAANAAATDEARRSLALETRLGKLEAENKGLVEKLRLQDEAAAKAVEQAKLREHVVKATALLVNGEKIAAFILDHADTVEAADAELKRIREMAKIDEVAEGLRPGMGGKSEAPPAADTFESSDGGPAGGSISSLQEARDRILSAAGGGRPKAAAPAPK